VPEGSDVPFQNYVAAIFSELLIERLAPPLAGVYGLSNAREWIFVGETENIKAALLTHLQATNRAVADRSPTGFTFEVCSPHARFARQDRLIQELEPVCNRSTPHAEPRRRDMVG
jgi:hypothetical protein